ncbi:VOC family protein [Roseobacter sp. S98]|uniref:VOC family protein n=1 Tax=Roseobacter algicola (ex Choi et al. 2025) (nom. illeg.) TaxID=3092138 RepID=UPI0035C75CCE
MLLDHLAVSGATLAEATAHVEDALDVRMQPGGEHDVFHTHNTLLGLEDGLYLEAIAVNPDAPDPDRPRWFDLDRFSGPARLTNWICRSDDLTGELAAVRMDLGAPVALQRGDLRWSMAVPASGRLPFDNCAPALIQWQTKVHPAEKLAPAGVRLKRLTIRHPDADDLGGALRDHLQDDRIAFEAGEAGLHAAFGTPHGERMLGS